MSGQYYLSADDLWSKVEPMQPTVQTISDPATLAALAQPTRLKLLEMLREPASAASAARTLGEPRQRVNYHLKALEAAGLVKPAGERQRGNFTEHLFQTSARRFVISPGVLWDRELREKALSSQVALAQLADAGARIQRDAELLIDTSAEGSEPVPSATISSTITLPAERRAEFLRRYTELIAPLLREFDGPTGEPYALTTVIYPGGFNHE